MSSNVGQRKRAMIKEIPVVLGTAGFGTSICQKDAWAILDKYASLGGRIIDTANNYAFWHPKGRGGDSESVIGNWLEKNDRSAFTIMTKIGSQPVALEEDIHHMEGLSPEAVHSAVNRSLTRLKTEYIDILLAHHDDKNTPIRATWESFTKLIATGKVKKVGVSNYQPERIVALANTVLEYDLAPVDVVQLKHSIISPMPTADFGQLILLDKEMKETLKKYLPDAVIFGYSVLLGGLFEKGVEDEWPPEYDSVQNRRKVREIQRKAKELGISPSAYVLKQIANQGVLPITTTGKVERLELNMKLFCSKSG